MVDEAGTHFPVRGTIVAITEPESIEIILEADTGGGPIEDVFLRLQFHDHGDRTRVTLHQGPFTPEMLRDTAVGWEMSFVKLDRILAGAAA